MALNKEQQEALARYRSGKADPAGFLKSLELGAKKRAAGIGETALKMAGEGLPRGLDPLGLTKLVSEEDVAPYVEDIVDLQRQYEEQGKGSGITGFAGEVLGDPLTYLPVGKGANLVRNLIAQGALSGATRGTGDVEADLSDIAKQAATEGATSALLGKATQKLLKPVAKEADKIASKNIKILQKEGVALTPAQKTGSKGLELMEEGFKDLPLTSGQAQKVVEKQLGQFTKAALRKAGIKEELATPEVLAAAQKSFDKRYSNFVDKAKAKVDDKLLTSLAELDAEARRRFGTEASRITSFVDDILESGGVISGKTYQNTRNALSNLQRSSDTLVSHLSGKLKASLDDAVDSQIPESLAKARQKLNKEYGAFIQINKAMSTTTDEAASGFITPARLLGAGKVGNKRFAQGSGEVLDLARAGRDVISSKIPDSGTAKRSLMQSLLTGGALAGLSGEPVAATAIAIPKAVQAAYGTKAAQKYLTEGITESVVPAVAAARIGKESVAPDIGPIKTEQPAGMTLNEDQAKALKEFRQRKQGGTESPFFDQLAKVESGDLGYGAQAKTSSAYGKYQITSGTAKALIKKYGKSLGVTGDNWKKPANQEKLARALTQENQAFLRNRLGREPSAGELYIVHFAGPSGAKKLLSKANNNRKAAALMPKEAKANKSIYYVTDKGGKIVRPRTVYEVRELLKRKMEA